MDYLKSIGYPSNDPDWLAEVAASKAAGDDVTGLCVFFSEPEAVAHNAEFFTGKNASIGATDFWDSGMSVARPLVVQPPGEPSPLAIGMVLAMNDDDVGRWYTAQLDRAHKYRAIVKKMLDARRLAARAVSAPQYVMRERAGKGIWIYQYPPFAIELVETPSAGLPIVARSADLMRLGVGLLGWAEWESRLAATMPAEMRKKYLDLKFDDLKTFADGRGI